MFVCHEWINRCVTLEEMRCFTSGSRSHVIVSSEMENRGASCYRLWVSMRAPLRKWAILCFEQECCMEKYNALGQWTLYSAVEHKAINLWGPFFKQIFVPGLRIDFNICAISPELGFRIYYMRTQSKDCREFPEPGCGNGLVFCPFMWQDIFLYVLEKLFCLRSLRLLSSMLLHSFT